jgi:hypothetical protein
MITKEIVVKKTMEFKNNAQAEAYQKDLETLIDALPVDFMKQIKKVHKLPGMSGVLKKMGVEIE